LKRKPAKYLNKQGITKSTEEDKLKSNFRVIHGLRGQSRPSPPEIFVVFENNTLTMLKIK